MMKIKWLMLIGLVSTTLWSIDASAQYVSNQSHCLSMDSSNNTSSMAFMENRCSYDLRVKYCFGIGNCQTNPGATTVPARGKKTVYRQHREHPHRLLISFACRTDDDFTACQQAMNAFFRSRVR